MKIASKIGFIEVKIRSIATKFRGKIYINFSSENFDWNWNVALKFPQIHLTEITKHTTKNFDLSQNFHVCKM